jgi:16S rRNA (cytosine1402-N4)-methyltransferase
VPATHVPVFLTRTIDLLAPAVAAPGAVVVDATVGLGGHSAALLERFETVRVIGLDRDRDALSAATNRLATYGGRALLVHAVYDQLADVLSDHGVERVQGVLFDLGVSSLQLDEERRGFSYAHDAPLDMRMDQTQGRTAADVVNTYDAAHLARVLHEYGEERFARRIAGAVVRERQREPFAGTARLADLVRDAIPAATRRTGGHPAKRTFQALRIEVNGELAALERALPAAVDALAVSGRLVVLAYHSLEDRIVKRVLRAGASSTAPPGLPVVPAGYEPVLRLLTRGAEQPTADEVAANPRAASARLRAAERIRDAA